MVDTFILQWHLTNRCNLKCMHCYQEDKKTEEMSYEKILKIYKQFKDFLNKHNLKGHINITGGEPLCSSYLFRLLEQINKDKISFCILTNGTLITKEIAKKIKQYDPQYVQVSLEGGKKVNDRIRGKGTYEQIANGIRNLRENNIYTSISFTANKLNYIEFPKVVKYGVKNKVNNIWTDRYIPLGDSSDKNLALNFEETREYLKILNDQRQKLLKRNSFTTISMRRALQFQMTGEFAYGCTAGDTLLTVMEDATLVPCRRMPIEIGNLLNDNITNLYENSPILKNLRENNVPDECKLCEYEKRCHGGLKCLTYAIFKDLNHKDIGCER